MKVLLLPSWYPDDNNPINGIFFKEQGEALARQGIEIIVLNINIMSLNEITSKNKLGLQVYIENGVKVYKYTTYNYFPRLTGLYLRYYGKLIKKLIPKIIKVEGVIDLVHIHSALDAGLAYYFSNVKIPYVLTEHSTKYEREIINHTHKKYLPKVFQNCHQLIAVGDGLKGQMSKYIGVDKIIIIPNMVSVYRSNVALDLEKKVFRFFSLGFLMKKKGMDILIEAFNKYKDELGQCELYIGGDGEEYNALKEMINCYKLQDNVKLLGRLDRDEVAFQMSNCDCFVLASRFETFGIVYLEAMIYGKPVIASKTGGPDSFVNYDNGILVQVDDVNGFGEAMVKIKNNVNAYDKDKISQYCINNFGEVAVTNKIIAVYKEICKKMRTIGM